MGTCQLMFEDFVLERIDVGEAELRERHGGSGLPLLLLHGHPRTHATWHRVAPLLARDHTVVCPDLRGYGESSKPAATPDHEQYSKRAMARDRVALMRALGHDRFAVAATIAAATSRFASRSTIRTWQHTWW
jgi:haloacetate dehalogenase